jgi:predicted O-methyltransferase YrrM
MRPEQVQARPECPEPKRWTAPDSDATETDVSMLVGAFVTALKPDYVIETGSYYGHTSKSIGAALWGLKRGHLVSLEIIPEYAEQARANVVGLPVSVVLQPASEFVPTQPIDLMFLDCSFEDRIKQLYAYRPHASPRCVILTHDTALSDHEDHVKAWYGEMDRVVAEGLVLPWIKLPTPRGVALTRYC